MGQIINKLVSFIGEVAETILIALAVFLAVYLFLAQPHRVKGDSMHPNFADGELILTDKLSYRFRSPERGEIVVFKAEPTQRRFDFIKRIIALPGERVRIESGKVLINGQELVEPYLEPSMTTTVKSNSPVSEGGDYQVPENSFFVMGDNRSASFDSRDWGSVKKTDLVGKAFFVYWPPLASRQSPGIRLVPQAKFAKELTFTH